MFQLALIAKENIDIDNLNKPWYRSISIPALIEEAPDSKNNQDKAATTAKTKTKKGEDEANAIKKIKVKMFSKMRQDEAVKRIKTLFFLALRIKSKRFFFAQKLLKQKSLGTLP